jgi:hypothetical protein
MLPITFRSYLYPADNSSRVRKLSYWYVSLRTDSNGSWLSLNGFVDSGENERPLDNGAVRFTTTSPIQSVTGNDTVITKSGSQYTVIGEPTYQHTMFLKEHGLSPDTTLKDILNHFDPIFSNK